MPHDRSGELVGGVMARHETQGGSGKTRNTVLKDIPTGQPPGLNRNLTRPDRASLAIKPVKQSYGQVFINHIRWRSINHVRAAGTRKDFIAQGRLARVCQGPVQLDNSIWPDSPGLIKSPIAIM